MHKPFFEVDQGWISSYQQVLLLYTYCGGWDHTYDQTTQIVPMVWLKNWSNPLVPDPTCFLGWHGLWKVCYYSDLIIAICFNCLNFGEGSLNKISEYPPIALAFCPFRFIFILDILEQKNTKTLVGKKRCIKRISGG